MSRDDNEPIPDVPQIVPDRDDRAGYERNKPVKPKATRERAAADAPPPRQSSGGALVYIVGVIAIAGAAWAGYLHTELTKATERVLALEERLSSTDESVNQSSVALQVKIKEVDEALTQVRDDALAKINGRIDRQAAQLTALEKAAKSTQATAAATEKRVGEVSGTLDGARAQIEKALAAADANKQKVDQHQTSLDSLSNKLKAVSDGQTKLDARLSNNEEWVESINTFRKQMNREIVNIKQQIAGGKPAVSGDIQ